MLVLLQTIWPYAPDWNIELYINAQQVLYSTIGGIGIKILGGTIS